MKNSCSINGNSCLKKKLSWFLFFCFFCSKVAPQITTHRVAIWKAMGFGVKSIEFWGEKLWVLG